MKLVTNTIGPASTLAIDCEMSLHSSLRLFFSNDLASVLTDHVQITRKTDGWDELKIEFKPDSPYRAQLLGGKGGFGSLLKSIKAKKQPHLGVDSYRDLATGRRVGHVRQQQRLAEWRRQ